MLHATQTEKKKKKKHKDSGSVNQAQSNVF